MALLVSPSNLHFLVLVLIYFGLAFLRRCQSWIGLLIFALLLSFLASYRSRKYLFHCWPLCFHCLVHLWQTSQSQDPHRNHPYRYYYQTCCSANYFFSPHPSYRSTWTTLLLSLSSLLHRLHYSVMAVLLVHPFGLADSSSYSRRSCQWQSAAFASL